MSDRIIFFTLLAVLHGFNSALIYESFTVESIIVCRYAHTTITSVLRNSAEASKDVSFKVQLPDTAFISNFTM